MKHLAISVLAGTALLGFMSASYAADLIIDEQPVDVGVVDVSGDWDGVYVGVFAGYGWGSADEPNGDIGFTDDTLDLSGWMLGVTAGANFTVGSGIVAGIVGDLAWANIGGSEFAGDSTIDIDWTGSLRGRLGFDGGAFLPYLTGGLAVAGVSAFDDPDEDSATMVGWTVGAGVEFAVAENISIDLLYRYSDYGSNDFDLGFVALTPIDVTAHTIQIGLNVGF